ncbi:hypothetical protein R5R35_005397 [Gryllus longicercus]|uniref:Uncharacterized protein n=1 Tax=Gryllus longicercus TaxID=2509291 RepID=A0AAN9YZF7_9ORTH
MFWILRRTRLTSAAASHALFNNINNNNNNIPGTSNNNVAGGARPKKGYNKLSSEDADGNVAPNEGACAADRGPQPSSDSESNCTDLDVEDDLSDDSDYVHFGVHVQSKTVAAAAGRR